MPTVMTVHMGIACQSCGRVYFIARTERIEFSSSPRSNPYQLNCMAPCEAVRFFEMRDMKPYSVSTFSYERGYADRGEYEVVRLAG